MSMPSYSVDLISLAIGVVLGIILFLALAAVMGRER